MTLEEEWEALSATEPVDIPESVGGVDLRMLADDTEDCLNVLFLGPAFDPVRVGTLRACESEIRAALPSLSGPAAVYFEKLADIARSALLQRIGRHGVDFLR